ncbi:MAG: hypothetical protein SYC29_02925 [Planctomycetota bacterium]|nr:hypothetical protein [Planctomycetota bacterium]
MSSAHYSDAVRVAQSEQLLVNLVRLRYRDQPVYLSVSSISTQFEFGVSGSVDGNLVESGPDALGLGAGVGYAERPTITFGILSGDAFERRMLETISVNDIALLAESGWRVDRVLRLTAEGLNGLKHADTASGPTPATEPEYGRFLEAVTLLQELREQGLIEFEYELRDKLFSDPIPRTQLSGEDLIIAGREGIEFKRVGDSDDYQPMLEERRLVLRFLPGADGSAGVARLRSLLRLDPSRTRIDFVPPDDAEVDTLDDAGNLSQIIVDTRSLMGVLYYLSHGVDPPSDALADNSVTATVTRAGEPFDWSRLLRGLFRVSHSRERPADAAVAVRHRGSWFFIADDDETSKSTFLLLRHLFTLHSGESQFIKPVLTLPVGR